MLKKILTMLFLINASWVYADNKFVLDVPFGDMYDSSDFVGLIRVVKGEWLGVGAYRLDYKSLYLGKGEESLGGNVFFYKNVFADYPSTLGGYYLVFLEKRDGVFSVISKGYSVIEVSPIDPERVDLNIVFSKLSIDRSKTVAISNQRLWYPSVCTRSNEILCNKAVSVLKVFAAKQPATK